MINPRIEINLKKIEHNTGEIVKKCFQHNIEVAGVTKVFCADIDVASAMVKGGVKYLADTRIQNIVKLSSLDVPKMLLRIPMQSEIEDVVRFCDYSLNSEIETIKMISNEALRQGKIHRVILMADLGDLREGIWHEEFCDTVEPIIKLPGVEIAGIGTNLTCYGGVIPSYENLSILCNLSETLKNKYNLNPSIISGGNSSSLYLLEKDEIPECINNLRIGEAIALGRETAYGLKIDNLYDDAVILYAEIIELKYKPSKPIGNIGMDAFGNIPYIEDMGLRDRAILAIGRQDINFEGVTPVDSSIKVIGGSGDHFIIDVTDCNLQYSTGDEIGFKINYGCLLKSMTSPYINKVKI